MATRQTSTKKEMAFLQWSCQDVAKWIESIGYPQYTACFTENFITGRKLIYVNCCNLPRLGITDFRHMQVNVPNALFPLYYSSNHAQGELEYLAQICPESPEVLSVLHSLYMICQLVEDKEISAHVRVLLGITEPLWSRSIVDPPRDDMGMYLEVKSRTGKKADSLTYAEFLNNRKK